MATSQRRSARISAASQNAISQSASTEAKSTDVKQSLRKSRVGGTKAAAATQSASNSETTTAAGTKAPKRKKKQEDDTADGPSTPIRKRMSNAQDVAAAASFPPSTPKRTKKNNTGGGTQPDLNRPVDPHHSTATLITPHGSHITAYPNNIDPNASPSKTGLSRPSATTGNILEHGIAHLVNVEPRLQAIIDKHPLPPFGPADLAEEVDPFHSLTSGIIGQQVSGAAAKSIKKKFIALFNQGQNPQDDAEYDYNDSANPHFPTPETVAKCDIATLRTAGLSQRKAEYIQGLAQKFASGELSARMLLRASDEEVLEKLIAVRGLGQWSVEMFSCFGLKRLDVFSTGDLGVQYALTPLSFGFLLRRFFLLWECC